MIFLLKIRFRREKIKMLKLEKINKGKLKKAVMFSFSLYGVILFIGLWISLFIFIFLEIDLAQYFIYYSVIPAFILGFYEIYLNFGDEYMQVQEIAQDIVEMINKSFREIESPEWVTLEDLSIGVRDSGIFYSYIRHRIMEYLGYSYGEEKGPEIEKKDERISEVVHGILGIVSKSFTKVKNFSELTAEDLNRSWDHSKKEQSWEYSKPYIRIKCRINEYVEYRYGEIRALKRGK